MDCAAEQAGMKLACKHHGTDASNGRDQGRTTGRGASAVVRDHEQETAAVTACKDPCKVVPTLKVGLNPSWPVQGTKPKPVADYRERCHAAQQL
jgi:hypothetical protein